MTWTNYTACAAIEGFDGEDHDDDEITDAFQHLINTGAAWSVQADRPRQTRNAWYFFMALK